MGQDFVGHRNTPIAQKRNKHSGVHTREHASRTSPAPPAPYKQAYNGTDPTSISIPTGLLVVHVSYQSTIYPYSDINRSHDWSYTHHPNGSTAMWRTGFMLKLPRMDFFPSRASLRPTRAATARSAHGSAARAHRILYSSCKTARRGQCFDVESLTLSSLHRSRLRSVPHGGTF